MVEQVAARHRRAEAAGVAVLLAEQNQHFTERVADRGYLLEKGIMRPA